VCFRRYHTVTALDVRWFVSLGVVAAVTYRTSRLHIVHLLDDISNVHRR
jgi:hypothetical protein